jgi:hypothetical protein
MAEFDDLGQPMMDVAGDDAAASRRVRRNLEILQENSSNPEFRDLVQDVLDGRRSLREVAGGSLFTSELTPHMEKFSEKWDETMAPGQEVMPDEAVQELKGLQAEVREKMAEIERQIREIQRLKDDLEGA